jgi:hypothetical protein
LADRPADAEPWYLDADDYYVEPAVADEYPLRQGDLVGPLEVEGEQWSVAQLIHPTCELPKPSAQELLVLRVRKLDEIADERQRRRMITGWEEKGGTFRVAFAHTFFLAPPPEAANVPLFSSFRDIARVDRALIDARPRIAALTHDARVTFIRRALYFWFRYRFSLRQVRDFETARITADPTFPGPRPSWAQLSR